MVCCKSRPPRRAKQLLTDRIAVAHRPFLIQCPLVLAGVFLAEFKLDVSTQNHIQTSSLGQKLKRIDFAGAFFMSLTILSSLTVLDLGGQKLPWTHPIVLAAIIAAVVCWIGFIVVEKFFAAEPIFPLHLVTHYVVLTSYVMLAMQNVAVMLVYPNSDISARGCVFTDSVR